MSQPIDRNLEQLARLLDGRQRRVLQPEDEQRAAVLVPLYENNNGLGLVLTRRTASLGRHAGYNLLHARARGRHLGPGRRLAVHLAG